ncbi:MAG TPA: PAP/fibrillin family protein [Allocoleopsis sp.]
MTENKAMLLKEKLQILLEEIQPNKDGSPTTDLQLDQTMVTQIEELTIQLENCNPHPNCLVNAISLLEGNWLLLYSNAREIRSLSSLPWGLKLGKVYQVIDITNKQFFNLAFVKQSLGLISGFVKVTASFEPSTEESGNNRINVYFDKRYLSIDRILNINTPQLNPFKIGSANNPLGRVATLDITYLDENFRIGRGGDGSLFILMKSDVITDKKN